MNTFKLFTLTICFALSYEVSHALQQDTKAEKMTMNYALQTYVDAIHFGKLRGLSQIIDENATFTMKRGDKLISNTKDEVLKAMKGQENVEQNCKITQSIVETLPTQMIVRVDMKYKTFTRTNFVTLSETNTGWKVSHVSSSFE
jgi:hypothetical protein